MKKYKTNEQLIEHLKSKNVIIDDENDAFNKIEKYTYYSIINSYKLTFKDSNGDYKENVTFDEIYALYEFDKHLRYIILKYALEVELIVKSLIANLISEKYGIKDYLKESNLDPKAKVTTKNKLIKKINDEIKKNYGSHAAITHYIDKYNFVPPYVLVKILSFGTMSSLYGLLKQSDRQEISKYFKISDKLLKQILRSLTSVRNICAHSERLFCFRDKHTIDFKTIDKKYKSPSNTTNLYMMIRVLKLILDKKDYREMNRLIRKEIKIFKSKLKVISTNDILKIMGYPNV